MRVINIVCNEFQFRVQHNTWYLVASCSFLPSHHIPNSNASLSKIPIPIITQSQSPWHLYIPLQHIRVQRLSNTAQNMSLAKQVASRFANCALQTVDVFLSGRDLGLLQWFCFVSVQISSTMSFFPSWILKWGRIFTFSTITGPVLAKVLEVGILDPAPGSIVVGVSSFLWCLHGRELWGLVCELHFVCFCVECQLWNLEFDLGYRLWRWRSSATGRHIRLSSHSYLLSTTYPGWVPNDVKSKSRRNLVLWSGSWCGWWLVVLANGDDLAQQLPTTWIPHTQIKAYA